MGSFAPECPEAHGRAQLQLKDASEDLPHYLVAAAADRPEAGVAGRPLAGPQAIRHNLVDLATSTHTCRCVTYDALRRFVAGEEPLREVTMAKLLTQRASFELMDACLQIHGGAGYMREYWVERAARDARLGPIGGGSDEIMREILGRLLGL